MTRTAMASGSRLVVLLLMIVAAATAQGEAPATAKKQDKGARAGAKSDRISANVDENGGEVTVYFVKRAVPVVGAPIDDATIIVQDGVIKAIGPRAEVEVPPTAKKVEAKDKVALPGFVNAAGLTYSTKNRYSTSGRGTAGNRKVSSSLRPSRKTGEALAKSGYTTVAVIPTGGGLAGLGCLVKPVKGGDDPVELADIMREDGIVLAMGFDAGTASKKMWTDTLGKARKYITDLAAYEEAKKKAPKGGAKPKSSGKPASKPANKPASDPKKSGDEKGGAKDPAKKPATPTKGGKPAAGKQEKKAGQEKPEDKGPKEPKKDDKLQPLIDVLQGKQAGLLSMDAASDLLHFEELFETEKAFRPALLMVATGNRSQVQAWRVIDQIKALGVPVILSPRIGTAPRASAIRRVTQRRMLEAGVPVAIAPPFNATGESLRFQLLELVRHGIGEDLVLRAVTMTPAEILGIQDRCGSLEAGKDADILLFDGDPFAPTTELVEVLVGGETVYARKENR